MKPEIERYENENGEIAVLISPGYGAGWSTWNYSELCYDKRVVEFWMEHADDEEYLCKLAKVNYDDAFRKEIDKMFESWGYREVYYGGFNQIQIVWMRKGSVFRVAEYDGAEHIEMFNEAGWLVAR